MTGSTMQNVWCGRYPDSPYKCTPEGAVEGSVEGARRGGGGGAGEGAAHGGGSGGGAPRTTLLVQVWFLAAAAIK
jgi:hypothetical protein